MTTLDRDGVQLGYEDAGSGDPPIVLVHGWTSNRWFLHEQAEYFAKSHRVINVDLRGHGESDAPDQEYTVEGFADDIAWMIGELGLDRPVVAGHSMGGSIVMQLAAAHGDVLRAIVLIDPGPLDPAPELAEAFGNAFAGMQTDLNGTREALLDSFFLPRHNTSVRDAVQEQAKLAPDHVVINEFGNFLQWDPNAAAAQISVPTLHIAAEPGFNRASTFEAAIPGVVNGKTVGAGHAHLLEVPDQVNSMMAEFIREYL